MNVIVLLFTFTKYLLIKASRNPVACIIPKPIKAINKLLNVVKLMKFLEAVLTIYLIPSKLNKFSTITILFSRLPVA